MNEWNKWEHVFLNGEYASRKKILSGLSLNQVTELPQGIKHSIYDELWHATNGKIL